ncbi:MAG: SCO family protein [Campylobacterales bacterium]|nr:SCO family protein [Campylobacterales bacterium]
MNKLKKIILVLVPTLFVLVVAGFFYVKHTNEVAKYDFVLQSDKGEVRLSDFRGKKTLVYFGYGLCPDICPTTLYAISEALNKLTPAEVENVRVVFVSVDPDRDKPKDLGAFARYFHENIIGTTADEAYIAKLATNYGASYKKVPQPNSSIGYSVAHSADTYVVGKDGVLESVLPFGVASDEIVAAIKK